MNRYFKTLGVFLWCLSGISFIVGISPFLGDISIFLIGEIRSTTPNVTELFHKDMKEFVSSITPAVASLVGGTFLYYMDRVIRPSRDTPSPSVRNGNQS